MKYHYVWLIWSCAFLAPWIFLYLFCNPQLKVHMWWASLYMALFAFTEPLFVPEYWNPPSLFDLAQKTGFDIESYIFSFAIGGIGAVLYTSLMHKRLEPIEIDGRHTGRHRWHWLALTTPFISFPILYFMPWNAIYAGITAMLLESIATVLCRPDLKANVLGGGILFFALYATFLLGLKLSAPGYIEQVWNFKKLSGVVIYGIPLEELLFGFFFWPNVDGDI